VDDALRGRGIAGRLTALAVSRIEKNGGTVQASCSYGQHWLSSHKKDQ
jgi:predicted GNAT family acetyltransferase